MYMRLEVGILSALGTRAYLGRGRVPWPQWQNGYRFFMVLCWLS